MTDILRVFIKTLLKILYIFPVKRNRVYLVSFNGKNYGYEPKAFAEYLLSNFPGEYEIAWEISDSYNFRDIKDIVLVNKKSLKSLVYSLTSGILLFNTTPRSYIPYRKSQYIVETWHGYPFKKVGKYAIRYNKSVYSVPTVYTSHSDFYERNVVRDSFEYSGRVINCGSPRNDIFFAPNISEIQAKIRGILGIEETLHVALFAPTFRGDFEIADEMLDETLIIDSLQYRFGGKWVLLKRYHPMAISAHLDVIDKNSRYDVSLYPDMQDLLVVADVLISDYSGSIWDFSLSKKPVFLYTPDLDEYEQNRGLYYPHRSLPYSIAITKDELANNIRTFDDDIYQEKLTNFMLDMGSHEHGKACETILDDYLNQHKQ